MTTPHRIICSALLAALTLVCHAADIEWAAGTGAWTNPANWAGGIYLGRANGVGQIVVRNGGRLESTATGDGMPIGRMDSSAAITARRSMATRPSRRAACSRPAPASAV